MTSLNVSTGARNIATLLATITGTLALINGLVAPSAAFASDCSQVTGTTTVNVTQNVSNDPDSGIFGGNWALDTFTRHIQIWQDGNQYCGKADDTGTFTTFGGAQGRSPQSGAALPEVVTGTMTGGTFGVLTGTLGDAGRWVASGTPAAACASGYDCSALTHTWVQNFFPGGSYAYGSNWGWTYAADSAHGTWVNAAASSTGDILHVVPTTVYVSANGNDANYGDAAHPLATIAAALATVPDNGTIILSSDVTIGAAVTVAKPVTIDGANHTLFAPFSKTDNSNNAAIIITHSNVTVKNLVEDGTNSSHLHGVNVYVASNVLLDHVTVQNNSAAGIVDGGQVTVTSVTTHNNAWGGINVDQGSGVTSPVALTINGASTHAETGPSIWKDDNSKTGVTVIDSNNQYGSASYVHDSNVTGTIYALKSVTVSSVAEFNAALANPLVTTIIFGGNITDSTAALQITRGVTIDGAGHTLFTNFSKTSSSNNAGLVITHSDVTVKNLTVDGTSGTNLHGINVYVASNVLLDHVTAANNAHAGIIAGGQVTVNSVTTMNNGWGGINVDSGAGVTSPVSLTVTGTSVHLEAMGPSIWKDDNSKSNVSFADNGQYDAKLYTHDAGITGTKYSLKNSNVKTTANQQMGLQSGSVAVTATIPAGTVVSGNAQWNGTVDAPTVTTANVAIAGFNTNVTSAITIGSTVSDLVFDKAVRLVFAGQAGKSAGWYNHAGVFTQITADCAATGGDTEAAQTASLAAGTSCKMDVGGDLVVWTKHFSTFATYTQTPFQPSTAGSSGSGFSSSGPSVQTPTAAPAVVAPVVPAATGTVAAAAGEVRGAQVFRFSTYLVRGRTSPDVAKLQAILIAKGHLKVAAPTSYFGAMTEAAVKRFQAANGIAKTGTVGPKTRAALNLSATPVS